MAWDKTDDEIIAYLSDELSTSDREAFERRLATDPGLADAIERHRAFEKRLAEYGEFKSSSEEIKKLNQRFSQNHRRRKIISYILVATTIISLISFILLNQKQTVCSEDIFARTFVPISSAPAYAGQGLAAEQMLQMAHSQYNAKNYTDALKYYREAIASNGLSSLQQDEAYFFLGQITLIEKKFTETLDLLSAIRDNPYLQQSQWFEGLALLGIGQKEQAKSVFEVIAADEANDYQKEATTLLGKWDRISLCD